MEENEKYPQQTVGYLKYENYLKLLARETIGSNDMFTCLLEKQN